MYSRNSNKAILLILALIVLVAGIILWRAHVRDSKEMSGSLQERVLAVASELRVPSEHDTMTVATSPETQAQHMRYQIQQDLLNGDTRREIIDKMVTQYGSGVLAAPPARGFGGVVWYAPLIAILLALAFLVLYVIRFRRGKDLPTTMVDSNSAESQGACISESIDSHLKDYL